MDAFVHGFEFGLGLWLSAIIGLPVLAFVAFVMREYERRR